MEWFVFEDPHPANEVLKVVASILRWFETI